MAEFTIAREISRGRLIYPSSVPAKGACGRAARSLTGETRCRRVRCIQNVTLKTVVEAFLQACFLKHHFTGGRLTFKISRARESSFTGTATHDPKSLLGGKYCVTTCSAGSFCFSCAARTLRKLTLLRNHSHPHPPFLVSSLVSPQKHGIEALPLPLLL